MATVTDYASLTQAILDWTNRADLSGFTDYFIQEAEDRIYFETLSRNMGRGTRDMEAAFPNGEAISGTGTVPVSDLSGYLAIKTFYVSTGGNTWPMERLTLEGMYSQFPNRQASGTPAYFTREGSNFIFGPVPDSTYSVGGVYWKRSAALSSGNTTTWMTTAIPSVLLAYSLAAAFKFAKDTESAVAWETLAADGLQRYIDADQTEDLSGSSLVMRSA